MTVLPRQWESELPACTPIYEEHGLATKHRWMLVPHHVDSAPGWQIEICRRCPAKRRVKVKSTKELLS